MGISRFLWRDAKGSILTEYALSSLVIIFTLLTIMEFGFEVVMRQQAEHGVTQAATRYSLTGSSEQAQDAGAAVMLSAFRECVAPLDIVLYDDMTSIAQDLGRQAEGTGSDASARIAQITLTCSWTRVTPIVRAVLGPRMTQSSTTIVRMR